MPQPPRGPRSPGPDTAAPYVRAVVRVRHLRSAVPQALLLPAVVLLAAAGCRGTDRALSPRDLSRDETAYVERVLVLERVRAALLVDAGRGIALGDSLAAAWGDSALPQTIALAPADPSRAELVHEFLLRLLAAEHDSLLARDGRRPLDAPWPVPADSVSGAGFPSASPVQAGD
ncbi:MAG: hypothetical protein IPK64_07475 [bacterium]|nr:hypothetical protein [bacterium]